MTLRVEEAPRAQPQVIPPTQAALEALAHTRETALFMRQSIDKLYEIAEAQQTPPEFHTIAINDGNNGRYTRLAPSRWEAKSIGIINPNSVPVYLGITSSPTAGGRALACAPQAMLVLPVAVRDIELGCDPTALGANTAVVYLLRFLTVQPLNLQLLA